VKRCILFLLVMLSTFSISWAEGTAQRAAQQPIGVFTKDDGKTIVVGIGTTQPLAALDVSRGEIKLGSTGVACTHTLAGTLRYAATRLQLCDGRQWRNISLDKTE
jgi:hypothetical protein